MERRDRSVPEPVHRDLPQPFQLPPQTLMFHQLSDQIPQSVTIAAVIPQYSYFAIPGQDFPYHATSITSNAITPGAIPSGAIAPMPLSMAPQYPRPIMHPFAVPLASAVELHRTGSMNTPTRIHQPSMTLERVVDPVAMPIRILAKGTEPPKWGVIKISNIPYNITKAEISQLLGRNTRLIPSDKGCAIHIIMERSTAKTMDCYVEFLTVADAQTAFDRLTFQQESGRPLRLGNRHIILEMSSQDALLKDLFPRAKCVAWEGGHPRLTPNNDPYCSGFHGFLTSEELLGVVRHAENSQRSPFAGKSLQRTYECMISTMDKFPWYATTMYTVQDRNNIFQAVNRLVMHLGPIAGKNQSVGLDQKLLHNLLQAGYRCPGFNNRQKFTLAINSTQPQEIANCPDIAKYWPFDTLATKPNTSQEDVLFYASLISKGSSVRCVGTEKLPNSFRDNSFLGNSPYGRVWFEWDFGDPCTKWEAAIQCEMQIAKTLITDGFEARHLIYHQPLILRPGPVETMDVTGSGSNTQKASGSSSGEETETEVTVRRVVLNRRRGGARGSSGGDRPSMSNTPSNGKSNPNPNSDRSPSPLSGRVTYGATSNSPCLQQPICGVISGNRSRGGGNWSGSNN